MDAPPLSAAQRRLARWGVASIWLATGLLVLAPSYRAVGHGYLVRLGLPDGLMWATCALEVALALRVALGPPSTWLTLLQAGMVVTFSVILAALDPMLLVHPYGVLTKNLPMLGLLAFLWLAWREGATPRAVWLLRASMALIWMTEGCFPKLLFQQRMELDVVAESGLVPLSPSVFLYLLGSAQVASGIAVLLLRGWPRRWLVFGQFLALLVLPTLVSLHHADLWVHPFGPMTKNLPILAGTWLVLTVLPPDSFLTARWSHLSMFHFAIPKELAAKHLPAGVELDLRDGEAWASVVLLEFDRTCVLGLPALLARRFSDVNLRIYAKRGAQHGVVFVRELASSSLVSLGANVIYGEHFVTADITPHIETSGDSVRTERVVALAGKRHVVRLHAEGPATVPGPESDAHFFKERGWGFGRARSGATVVYRVVHPEWAVRPVVEHALEVDFAALYGAEWGVLDAGPRLVHYAVGSDVVVYPRRAA